MTDTHPPQTETHPGRPSAHAAAAGSDKNPVIKIHRVCIGCNNMFEVTMDNYEAKHCPACHKA